MFRRRLMRVIDIAAITIGLVFAVNASAPQAATLVARHHAAYCVKAAPGRDIPTHTAKAYKDKHGNVHPAHTVAAHHYGGHKAYCVAAK